MEIVYVIDFGSQYSHLIVRRIREMGVLAELVSPGFSLDKLKQARGIILSGGPQNLSESTALRINKKVFDFGVPVLGICYGQQLMAFELGGKVTAGKHREYGPMQVRVKNNDKLFQGLKADQATWMSHGDQVTRLPKGFKTIASSFNCPVAGISNPAKNLYAIQFHPEVVHTKNGLKILANFLKICRIKKTWVLADFAKEEIKKVKAQVGKDKVVCALSGGVDSAVAALIVHKAIGSQLTCVYVDTGCMRLNETKEIKNIFKKYKKFNLKIVHAEKEFLAKLKGVTDPEKKRKAMGELFIRIFEREAKKIARLPSPRSGGSRQGQVKWLVQGTLYTDAISSGVSVGKTAALIKSHHNVGGLPKKFGFKLIEPLRELYKDEVRRIGTLLGLPKTLTERQPFPGPGLAVRIIGEVTKEKLDLLKKADHIVREEIEASKENAQQYFAVLPSIRSVGVQGDFRTYGHPIIIRAISTVDYMTADWARLSHQLLAKISARITNEVQGINRVVYDITSKPPGTVEWE